MQRSIAPSSLRAPEEAHEPRVKSWQLEPPPDFIDPRAGDGFQPEHWPLCNGGPAPPAGASDLHERRCLEFLAAFYRLNLLNGRLLAARNSKAGESIIRALLDDIETASQALEALEDRYAPIGLFGEPIMEGVRYRDIEFVRPALPQICPQAASVSSHIAIPGLEEIPPEELRGPVRIMRWNHGKVDS